MALMWWIVGLYILSIGVLLVAALVAPEGYEDKYGFHLGEPKKKPKIFTLNFLPSDTFSNDTGAESPRLERVNTKSPPHL